MVLGLLGLRLICIIASLVGLLLLAAIIRLVPVVVVSRLGVIFLLLLGWSLISLLFIATCALTRIVI